MEKVIWEKSRKTTENIYNKWNLIFGIQTFLNMVSGTDFFKRFNPSVNGYDFFLHHTSGDMKLLLNQLTNNDICYTDALKVFNKFQNEFIEHLEEVSTPKKVESDSSTEKIFTQKDYTRLEDIESRLLNLEEFCSAIDKIWEGKISNMVGSATKEEAQEEQKPKTYRQFAKENKEYQESKQQEQCFIKHRNKTGTCMKCKQCLWKHTNEETDPCGICRDSNLFVDKSTLSLNVVSIEEKESLLHIIGEKNVLCEKQEQEIERLKQEQEIERLKQKIEAFNFRINDTNTFVSKIMKEKDKARNMFYEEEKKSVELETKNKELLEVIQELKQQRDNARKNFTDLSKQLQELRDINNTLELKLQELRLNPDAPQWEKCSVCPQTILGIGDLPETQQLYLYNHLHSKFGAIQGNSRPQYEVNTDE